MLVKASSFPEGIMAAHQALHTKITNHPGRMYYGISYPDKDGKIQYYAAASELSLNEALDHQLEQMVLRKGNYYAEIIQDYMQNLSAIGNCFQQLISQSDIDPEACCIEWYKTRTEVQCMVQIKE